MPLHDWSDEDGWENFHDYWVFRIAERLKPILPAGYRVYIGSYGRAGLAAAAKPDIGVDARAGHGDSGAVPAESWVEPDAEVAVLQADPQRYAYVQRRGFVVAVVELVSPANKHGARQPETAARYTGYLSAGVHLLLIDVLPRPYEFSLADAIAGRIGLAGPPTPSPVAIAYRATPTHTGNQVNVWRRPLSVGQPLPTLPLPLSPGLSVPVDLDATYLKAADDAYLT